MEGVCDKCVESAFGKVQLIDKDGEYAFITSEMSEAEIDAAIEKLIGRGGVLKSRIRLL